MSDEKTYYPKYGLQVEDAAGKGDSEEASNLLRYWWAWTICKKVEAACVIDVGCGCGYGSRILAEQFSGQVYAIDWDPELISHARKNYSADNLEFRRINLDVPWAVQFPAADIVTCFHLLDKVDRPEWSAEEMCKVVAKRGAALFSLHSEVSLEKFYGSVSTIKTLKDGGSDDGSVEHGLFSYIYDVQEKYPDIEWDLDDLTLGAETKGGSDE